MSTVRTLLLMAAVSGGIAVLSHFGVLDARIAVGDAGGAKPQSQGAMEPEPPIPEMRPVVSSAIDVPVLPPVAPITIAPDTRPLPTEVLRAAPDEGTAPKQVSSAERLATTSVEVRGLETARGDAKGPETMALEVVDGADPICGGSCSNHYGGGRFCVEEVREGEAVALWGSNSFHVDVTVDLKVRASGLTARVEPTPHVIPPGSRGLLATYTLEDPKTKPHCGYRYSWTFGRSIEAPDTQAYALPFDPSRPHPITQGFEGRYSHRGIFAIDWEMPEGTPVLAAREGVVVAFHDSATEHGTEPAFLDPTRANWLLIRHPDGSLGAYWHLMPGGVKVMAGQVVGTGQLIALSGNTGYSAGPHLHFEVRSPIDAYVYRTYPVRFQGGGIQEGIQTASNQRSVGSASPDRARWSLIGWLERQLLR